MCICHLYLLWFECQDNTWVKRRTVCKDRGHIGFVFFCFVLHFFFFFVGMVSKHPKAPNLSPMDDGAITWTSIPGLRSPKY